MNTEGIVINKYTIINPELCEVNTILKNNVNVYDKRFEVFKIVCKWKLVFHNIFSIDVNSKVMSRISVLRHNIVKYSKKINFYRRQGLQFSHMSEKKITFKTSLDIMTYKHYIEQPMPMVERLVNRKLYKDYELLKTLVDIYLTLHMEACKNGEEDVHYNSDEDE